MLFNPDWKPTETETTIEPWKKVIRDAADLIEQKGWVQGTFQNREGFCIIGALREATGIGARLERYRESSEDTVLTLDRASTEVGKLLKNVPHYITVWNDMHGRTRKEVLDLLHKAGA